jgi:CelD/BcsL family acetyltransferase involved in cellulose biosynthesis
MKARILRRLDELADMEAAWWDLWHRCPSATPFQTPGWLVPWWRDFSPGDLFTLAVEHDGQLVGLAPLYIETGNLGRRILPVGISLSDYHDVLLDPSCAEEAWTAMRSAALESDAGWERWDWEELMPQAVALRLPWPDACAVETVPQSACPVLILAGSCLEDALPKAKRRKLNLARNRAAREGAVTVERARASDVGDFLEHLFRLHRLRWESQGEEGVLAPKPVQRFHHAAAPALEAAGLLRFYTLAFAGQVVATYYGFCQGERAFAYLSGFDPAHEFASPGALVMAHAIAEALSEGAREMHFLRGQEAYKYGWGANDVWNQRRTILRKTGRNAAA